jgi:putative flippase GtrA
MELIRKNKKNIYHFLKFMAVGCVNFGVDAGIGYILNQVLGVDIVIANIISYTCGVINSFLLNMFWTFKIRLRFFSLYTLKPGRVFKKGLQIWFFSVPFLKFVFVNLVSLGVNTLTMYILVGLYKIGYIEAKVLATAFSFVVNFAGSKLLVFKEEKKPEADKGEKGAS